MKSSTRIILALVTAITAVTAHAQVEVHADTISQSQMNREQLSNPLDAINGRVAGVTITKSDNGVAAMNAVRVRGTTSLTGGNDPLIIIDGVMGDLTTLAAVYPADIENFTILKDASETAQYGSRGASGVIRITTKKGKGKRTTISYNGSVGFITPYKNLNMLDAHGYRREVVARDLMLIDMGANTDWQRAIQRTGFQHDHHVAFTGGGDNNGYRVSIAYLNHDGVTLHEKMTNFTSNLSMYQRMFGDLLNIDIGMFGNVKKDKTAIYDMQKTFYSAATFNPTFPATGDINTGYSGFTYANQINHPLALMDSRTTDKTTHISTHAKLTFTFSPKWKLIAFGSYSHNEVERSQYLPTSIWAGGQALRSSEKTETLLGNISVKFDTKAGKSTFNVMAMAEAQREKLSGFKTTTTNFTADELGFYNIQAGALSLWEGTASYYEDPSQLSFLANCTWDYDGRYSITATARADGSSRFGNGNKWGLFPSLSGAWTLSKEAWLRDFKWLDNLKLRVGAGISGNQGGVSNYTTLNLLAPGGIVPVGQDLKVALISPRNVNPDLKWEIKRQVNFGIDAAFFGNRIIASLDFYTSKTVDMLYNYPVPVPPFTYPTLLANLGSMRNSGTELALGFTPLKTRDIELNINANITFQRNKLLSLSGDYHGLHVTAPDYVAIAGLNGAGFHGGNNNIVYQIVGQPLGVFYLPHADGLRPTDKGYAYNLVDLDGDQIINTDDGKDRYIAGQAVPKTLLGSNISLRFKQWDIAIQVNGAFGHKIFNGTSLSYMNMNSLPGYNVLAKAPERNIVDQAVSDYWLERGDYVNIDYITIGWNVPLKRDKVVRSLRVALTVNNIATITSYSGLTPMINSSNVNSTLGVDDKRTYPLARTCSLSVNLVF